MGLWACLKLWVCHLQASVVVCGHGIVAHFYVQREAMGRVLCLPRATFNVEQHPLGVVPVINLSRCCLHGVLGVCEAVGICEAVLVAEGYL